MANVIQSGAKKSMLDAILALGTLKATIVDTADYTYNSSHAFIANIPSAARVATASLTSVTTTAGVLDAADTVFATPSGDPSEALALWVDTGNEATSPFLSFWDAGVTGLPITPEGENITVQWHASGIFAL
jgi:hypothetical protein